MTNRRTTLSLVAALAAGLALGQIVPHLGLPAFAADEKTGHEMHDGMDHMMGDGMMGEGMMGSGKHGMGAVDPNAPASTQAFQKANARMHKDMDIAFTGNADVDFVRGMIPHHQGAIDMAKIVLEHGKDPQIRTLAEGIIKAQESEIAMMHGWLASHPQ